MEKKITTFIIWLISASKGLSPSLHRFIDDQVETTGTETIKLGSTALTLGDPSTRTSRFSGSAYTRSATFPTSQATEFTTDVISTGR